MSIRPASGAAEAISAAAGFCGTTGCWAAAEAAETGTQASPMARPLQPQFFAARFIS
jgi:hypothetical protein